MNNGAQLDFFFSFTWGPLPMGWCHPHSGLNPCRNSLIDIPCPEGCLLAEFPLHWVVNHLYINAFHRLDVTQLHTCGTTCLPQKFTDASVSFIYNQRNVPNDTIPNSLSVSSPSSLGNWSFLIRLEVEGWGKARAMGTMALKSERFRTVDSETGK